MMFQTRNRAHLASTPLGRASLVLINQIRSSTYRTSAGPFLEVCDSGRPPIAQRSGSTIRPFPSNKPQLGRYSCAIEQSAQRFVGTESSFSIVVEPETVVSTHRAGFRLFCACVPGERSLSPNRSKTEMVRDRTSYSWLPGSDSAKIRSTGDLRLLHLQLSRIRNANTHGRRDTLISVFPCRGNRNTCRKSIHKPHN